MLEGLKEQLIVWRERKHIMIWREVLWLYVGLFLVWGAYRLFLRFPVWMEEGIFKAVVYGLPVLLLARKKKYSLEDLGITRANFFSSVYMGLGLGVILGFIGQLGNIVRYGSLQLNDFGFSSEAFGGFIVLAFVTAFWEELVFAGFILKRLSEAIKSEQWLVVSAGAMFSLIHIPALLLQRIPLGQALLSIVLLVLLGVGNMILMRRHKNLIAPIMAHALWGITIFLFR